MRIGDEIYVHGYVDEIRQDTVIIRNSGGYFGTVPEEIRTEDDEKIAVGDEVYHLDRNVTRVVTAIFCNNDGDMTAVEITQSGKWAIDIISDLHKTGRHFPQISEVLKQLQEGKERVKDWHDIPAEEMTEDQLRQAVKDLRMIICSRYADGLSDRIEDDMIDAAVNTNEAYDKGVKEGYNKGAAEAWEAARKIVVFDASEGGLSFGEMDDLFGTPTVSATMREVTALDAITKIKEFEEVKPDLDLVPCQQADKTLDKAYKDGMDAAWNAARKICAGNFAGKLDTGMILNISASDAIETIKLYEAAKEEAELNVKAGDKVIVHGSWQTSICIVEKVTPTGRIKVNGLTFNKRGSLMSSDKWNPTHIEEWTEDKEKEILQNITIRKAVRLMRDYEASKVTYDMAVKILDLLEGKDGETSQQVTQ